MSRSELLTAKASIDAKLRSAKAELAQAKHRAWASGDRLPPDEYAALNDRISRLAGASHRAQAELAVMTARRQERGARLNDLFVDVARKVLPDELYWDIVAKAEAAAQH